MNIRGRLLKYIESKGISKYQFYKDVGVSNGFLDKEGSIGSDKCEKICYQYPDINLDWLITGRGEMLKSEEKEERIAFINQDDPAQKILLELLDKKDSRIEELKEEIGALKEANKKRYTDSDIPVSMVAESKINKKK